jgi:ethanolamine utilization protein EutA
VQGYGVSRPCRLSFFYGKIKYMHDILDHKDHERYKYHGIDHEHDEEPIGRLEDNALWIMDNIALKSVGIDIGSAGTQVTFSLLKLRRMGEELSSRYIVISRDSLYHSPVSLTPYTDDDRIDDEMIGKIIADAYEESGLRPEEIDTGVVILTGEAIRRHNAQAIAEVLARQGGEFVCAAAGHNMEALLAAYGSGAALASYEKGLRILNIDIGGGTTKLALVENGRVLETAAFYLGGRLLVVDEQGRIVRLDPGGAHLAREAGYNWQVGDRIERDDMQRLAGRMAQAVLQAALIRPLTPEMEKLFLTPPLRQLENIDGVMFSGGVGEYVYDREQRDFGDLGRLLGRELRERISGNGFPWPVLPAGECIRATVIGASSYSLQVSGNTIHLSSPSLLPRKNLQVLHPRCDLSGEIEPAKIAQSLREHFAMFDVKEGETEVALAFRWQGLPTYERISSFAGGLRQGLAETVKQGKAIFIVLDGDIAQTLGILLKEEGGVESEALVIDGITLQDFDFIDIGRMLEPSHTVPVTVKSLIFGQGVST